MWKCKRVWCNGGDDHWFVTTWRERKKGGKRRFLKTRPATTQEIENERQR